VPGMRKDGTERSSAEDIISVDSHCLKSRSSDASSADSDDITSPEHYKQWNEHVSTALKHKDSWDASTQSYRIEGLAHTLSIHSFEFVH
jgi:hypothetical protein